jgi:hypothetical protein
MTNTFTIGKHVIALEGRDLKNPSPAESAFLKSLNGLDDFIKLRTSIDTDPQLTALGRDVKILPLINNAWRIILRSSESVENERLALVQKEKDLFSVPKISTPYEVSMDRERRDWFRALSAPDLHKFLGGLKAGEDQTEMVHSLMRSPVPTLADRNLQIIEEVHRENRKAQFPDEWVAIEEGHAAISWAQRGMGHLIGFAYTSTRESSNAVCQFALKEGFNLAADTIWGKKAVAYAKQFGAFKTIEQVAATA